MFLRLINAANLTSLLSDSEQDLTLFIPKNDVFREVSEWYNDLFSNKRELTYIVKSHIVPGKYYSLLNLNLTLNS